MTSSIWQLFHQHRALAREQKTKPLACPDCGTFLITRVDSANEDQLLLWCPTCPSLKAPGVELIDRVKAVVSEHYV